MIRQLLSFHADKDLTASFNHTPKVYEKTFARWPQVSNPAIPAYSCATMGCESISSCRRAFLRKNVADGVKCEELGFYSTAMNCF